MGETSFKKFGFIGSVLDQCLLDIAGDKEIYLNEDDFKFSFAQALEKCGVKEGIILEYPMLTKDLYKGKEEVKKAFLQSYKKSRKKNKDFESDRTRIDVWFRYLNTEYFVELKYKQLAIEVTRYKQGFNLKDQSAQDDGMYAIHEDIERMEAIKNNTDHQGCMSYCVFITNDESYKKPHNGFQSKKVALCEKDENGKLHFLSKAGVRGYGEINPNRQGSKERFHRDLIIKKRYNTSFYEFKKLTTDQRNGQFWISIIDLQKPND